MKIQGLRASLNVKKSLVVEKRKPKMGQVLNYFSLQAERHNQKIHSVIDRSESVKTIIVLPSITLDSEDIRDIEGIQYYETRGLWEILKSTETDQEVIFISSLPLLEDSYEHLLSFFPNSDEMRNKITFFSLNDNRQGLSLAEKLLENSDVLEELSEKIKGKNCYLQSFISTEKELELAKKLNVPLYGAHPSLEIWSTKSGNRKIFEKSKINVIPGIEGIKSVSDLQSSIKKLWSENPLLSKFIVKHDLGVSGKGNAFLEMDISFVKFSKYSVVAQELYLLTRLSKMKIVDKSIGHQEFLKKIERGGVLEIFMENIFSSPSTQGIIHTDGKVEILSTHEQLLDDTAQVFQGSIFPAKENWAKINELD